MGVSENRGPNILNSRILIMRTPKQGTPIGNSLLDPSSEYREPRETVLLVF